MTIHEAYLEGNRLLAATIGQGVPEVKLHLQPV
jgi:hypothetical protein